MPTQRLNFFLIHKKKPKFDFIQIPLNRFEDFEEHHKPAPLDFQPGFEMSPVHQQLADFKLPDSLPPGHRTKLYSATYHEIEIIVELRAGRKFIFLYDNEKSLIFEGLFEQDADFEAIPENHIKQLRLKGITPGSFDHIKADIWVPNIPPAITPDDKAEEDRR